MVQGALRLILEPIFEADFSDSSFGARPGRSAHEAIEKVRTGLRRRRHRVVDVDLSRYFDTIRHDRMLAKVARRISDGQVLAMVKQFLKSTGDQGVPQGSPLSPLLANLALNDLDHVLDRGSGFITYARYLDDMVVLAPDSAKGKAWADRALARIRCEAEAIGVSLNTEKTRIVTITDEHAVFAFLGFEFRWVPSTKTGRWYPCMTPRPKKITAGPAEGAGHPAGEPAPAGAGGGRAGEPDPPGLGELLPGRQLESGVRQGAIPRGAQGEAIRGQAAQAQGIRLEAVE